MLTHQGLPCLNGHFLDDLDDFLLRDGIPITIWEYREILVVDPKAKLVADFSDLMVESMNDTEAIRLTGADSFSRCSNGLCNSLGNGQP